MKHPAKPCKSSLYRPEAEAQCNMAVTQQMQAQPMWPHHHPRTSSVTARWSPSPKHLLQQGSTLRNKLHSASARFPKPPALPMNLQSSRNKSMPGSLPKDVSELRYHRQGNRCCHSLSDGKFTQGLCHPAASGGILCLTRRETLE